MPSLVRLVAVALAVPLLTACSDDRRPAGTDAGGGGGADGGTVTGDAGAGGADAGRDAGSSVVTVPGTATLAIGPFNVHAGVERTQCISFDVGNEEAAYVREVRTHLTNGSHHMIVYRLDEPPDETPRPCGAFAHGVGDSIFIAQQLEASLTYPEGTGLPLEPHQTIGIEMHYINYFSDEPVDVEGTVELDLVPVDGSIEEMKLLFEGGTSITIPPRDTATVRTFHSVPAGARIFALTSHTHQLGTLATIHAGSSTADVGELLHESHDWAEPPLDTFDPPLVLDAGDGLVLTCEYTNPTDDTVYFGLGFEDEMCFLWAHYVE